MVKRFCWTFHLTVSAGTVEDLHSSLLTKELGESAALMPGAMKTLEWIREGGHPTALVTSSSRQYAEFYLDRLEVRSFFLEIVTAEDVQNGKPDPQPYEIGARRIQRDSADCIVLEDSVNGVLSGKASGATVIAVPAKDEARVHFSSADYIIDSLAEAVRIFEDMGL